MEHNLFLNKLLFIKHHNLKYRKERLNDFIKIYNILKNHLIPINKAKINIEKYKKYINLYKQENRDIIKNVLEKVIQINFTKFIKDLDELVDEFNKRIGKNKYIYVIGVTHACGSSIEDFTIYKSNLWLFMLIYTKLKNKPFDIILNLNIATRLYPNIDKLIIDDCSYSGEQLISNVLDIGSIEFLNQDKEGFIIESETKKNVLFSPIINKFSNIHLILPYISRIAYNKLINFELRSGFNIIKYNKYIVNSLEDILSKEIMSKFDTLYQEIINNPRIKVSNLIPLFFEHKIADGMSTIDLILIKGQVLDNKNLRLVFIDVCEYDKEKQETNIYNPTEYKDYNNKKINCPISPYMNFEKILKKNYK